MANQPPYEVREVRGILKKEKTGELKLQAVRFPDYEQDARHFVDKTADITKLAMNGNNIQSKNRKAFKALSGERDDFVESVNVWKKRAEELEDKTANILLDYDRLYMENKMLRDKLSTNQENYTDHDRTVYKDRIILREAEIEYKKRLAQLEQENRATIQSHDILYSENRFLRGKIKTLEDRTTDGIEKHRKVRKYRKQFKEKRPINETSEEILSKDIYSKTVQEYNYDNVIYDEPYARSYLDRQVFREAEQGYKNQIAKLEKKLTQRQETVERLEAEIKQLRNKPSQWIEYRNTETKLFKLQREFKSLKRENETLKVKIKRLASETTRNDLMTPRSNTFSSVSELRNLRKDSLPALSMKYRILETRFQ